MAYELKVYEGPSGVSLDITADSLLYRMAIGQTINGFYYDQASHIARWYYCGKEYRLTGLAYDRVVLAKDLSGFCCYDHECEEVCFYNSTGDMILQYRVGDDVELPEILGDSMILYLFVTNREVWWIYKGKRQRFNVRLSIEKIELGFYSNLYIKTMSRIEEGVYDAEGRLLYRLERYPQTLTISEHDIPFDGAGIIPLILERYQLIATMSFAEDYYYTSISLYTFDGEHHADISLPEGTVAFHSIKLLEHTDIPVIAVFEELPDTSRYFNNGIARSVRPNMPMKLRWYELLPDGDGRLALYKSGELYQGFRDIDTITLEDKHVHWR